VTKSISQFLPSDYQQNPEKFSWPVARDDIALVRDKFIKQIILISKNPQKEHHKYYKILGLLWVNQVIQAYHFLSACDAFKTAHIKPNFDGDCGFMRAIWNGDKPELPDYLNSLEQGLSSEPAFILFLKGLKRNFTPNPLKYKPNFLVNFDNDIIVSSTGELIFKHAENILKPLIYIPRSFWFKNHMPISRQSDYDFEEFFNIIEEAFGDKRTLITDIYKDWFKEIYTRSISACHAHIHYLQSNPNIIPKNLWIGSGGVMWDRIMKFVVTENGGSVTGHDHGSGIGHMVSKSRALSECNDCHYFVPFNKDKEMFSQALDHDFLFEDLPEITPIFQSQTTMDTSSHRPLQNIKKILVIPYGPDQNTSRFLTTPHDSVKSDFLIRILDQLKKLDYDVTLKPHPHCPLPLSKQYLEEHDITLATGNIEAAFNKTDAVLFLHHYTTTFREAFIHGLPIILIDPQFEKWVPDAFEKLKKRCSIIPSYYDENNRIQINFTKLEQEIKDASNRMDRAYFETYYQ
tara:strand:+ start:13977 stop:15527 length:1551 start_codon:yes stop_codon:yes gene_type:complete